MIDDAAYWITLAHIPGWGDARKHAIVAKLLQEQISITDFFGLSETDWETVFGLNAKETELLRAAIAKLPASQYVAEQLEREGIELIPVTSPGYSPALRRNIKAAHAPILFYAKGNTQILHEKAIVIAAAGDISEQLLAFATNIARKATREFKVLVSGLTTELEKQAIDAVVKHIGQSIIVLPHGILTDDATLKMYSQQVEEGDMLVLSSHHPRSHKGTVAAQLPMMYALADEIYVAGASEQDDTWKVLKEGIRKKRKIFVRQPAEDEILSNVLLIENGATSVDLKGNILLINGRSPAETALQEKQVLQLLKKGYFTTAEIIEKIALPWAETELRKFLKGHPDVKVYNKKPVRYSLKPRTLFD